MQTAKNQKGLIIIWLEIFNKLNKSYISRENSYFSIFNLIVFICSFLDILLTISFKKWKKMFLAYFNSGDNSWNHRFRYLHVWIHVSILSEFLNDFEYCTMPLASKIFTGYRALGYVSNHVPLAIRYQEKTKEHYVITSVGKSFHTYNVSMSSLILKV